MTDRRSLPRRLNPDARFVRGASVLTDATARALGTNLDKAAFIQSQCRLPERARCDALLTVLAGAATVEVPWGRAPEATVMIHDGQTHVDRFRLWDQRQGASWADFHAGQVLAHDTGHLPGNDVGQAASQLRVQDDALGRARRHALATTAACVSEPWLVQCPWWSKETPQRWRSRIYRTRRRIAKLIRDRLTHPFHLLQAPSQDLPKK